MKRLVKSFCTSRLLRPAFYKILSRSVIGFAAALLWNRFIDTAGRFSVYHHVFPIIAAIFAAMAWFSYLSLDGVTFPRFLKLSPKKQNSKRRTGDISDFTDEEIAPYEALDPDEQTLCRLAANAVCAVLFLLPALISAFS